MSVSGGGHDTSPIVGGRSGESPGIGAGPGVESARLDYRKSAAHLPACRRASWDGHNRAAMGAYKDPGPASGVDAG
jgi:hypothetical protein